jgi:hypothetical protein
MDKLVIPSGGMYLEAEDLEFQDAAYRNAVIAGIKAVAELTVSSVMIINGCNPIASNPNGQTTVNDTFSLSAGNIFINGEICAFMGATGNRGNNQVGEEPARYFYEFVSDFEPTGNEVLYNGTTGNAYQRRRVVLTRYTNQPDIALFYEQVPRYIDVLKEYVNVEYNTTANVVFIYNSWVAPTNNRLTMNRRNKNVFLEGQLVAGSFTPNTFSQIGKLSINFRPLQTIYRPCMIVGKGVCQLRIENDGFIYLNDTQNVLTSGDLVDFGGINFETD